MKIGIVTEYYYPTLGGIQEHVHHFALEAMSRGHEVRIITSHILDIKDGDDAARGIPVTRLGLGVPIYQNGSVARVTLAPLLGRKLQALFDREKFDVLHIHSPLNPTLPIISLLRSPTVTVGTFHTNFKASAFLTIFNRTCQKYLNHMDGLIAVSKTAIGALDRYFDASYKIIPNGIDTDKFSPTVPRLPEFSDGKFNVLWVGRMEPRNGLDLMIRAFLWASSMRDDLRLIAVGDGPLRRTYEDMVPPAFRDRVHFTGFVNTGRPALYASADILCVPATISSFGITLLEGMASGKAVIASDIEGFKDVMTGGEEGLMVDTADQTAFGSALLKLAGDRNLCAGFGERGRNTALRYSWPRITDLVLDYYVEAAENRKRKISAHA
jgi:phosphatidylinositol alpha-mannosyltransferase